MVASGPIFSEVGPVDIDRITVWTGGRLEFIQPYPPSLAVKGECVGELVIL